MKVSCSVLLLVAGLAFSSSAPTHQGCKEMLKVVSMSNRTKLYSTTNMIMAYSNHELHNAVLRHLKKSTMNISPAENDGVVVTHQRKVNETCYQVVININIEGDVGVAENVFNTSSSRFQMYEIANGTMGLVLNSTHTHPTKMLKHLFVSSHYAGNEVVDAQCFYLISTATSVDEVQVERFRKQAACLGFHGEPNFVFDGKTEMCGELESK